ncbi:TPA: hypothetical protein ACGU4V_004649 [Vibrio vulnificus]
MKFDRSTIIICALVSFTSSTGSKFFDSVSSELSGQLVFWTLLCLMLSISGAIGILACLGINSAVAKVIGRVSIQINNFFLSIVNVMFGLALGAVIYDLMLANWGQAIKGVGSLWVIYSQGLMSTKWLKQSLFYATGEGEIEAKEIKIFFGLHLIFFTLGFLGLIGLVT